MNANDCNIQAVQISPGHISINNTVIHARFNAQQFAEI